MVDAQESARDGGDPAGVGAMTLTFGSLFAGIGGLDLGLERAGMVCKWQVEIDPFCQKVLAKHWPDVARYEDVRDVGKHNLEPVDLICGGFPCQPHSVAGKRRGAADDRNLWPEYLRIVTELSPRWVLGENVPGIISNAYIDTVLADLEAQGYACGTFGIPAVAFDAPHRRQRIWIVAYASEKRARSIGGAIGADRRGGTRGNEPALRQDNGTHGTDWISPTGRIAADMAYVQSDRRGTRGVWGFAPSSQEQPKSQWPLSDLGDTTSRRQQEQRQPVTDAQARPEPECTSWWLPEPNVGRVADGIPGRVDRLRSLGNAVVPQVAEWIGRRIVEANG